jgi:hypothetical protein
MQNGQESGGVYLSISRGIFFHTELLSPALARKGHEQIVVYCGVCVIVCVRERETVRIMNLFV